MIGLHVNGATAPEVKLQATEGKNWRWVGPLQVSADRLDLAVSALSRWPFKDGEANRSFPVVVDLVAVSSEPSYVPPEKIGDDSRGSELLLDEPQK